MFVSVYLVPSFLLSVLCFSSSSCFFLLIILCFSSSLFVLKARMSPSFIKGYLTWLENQAHHRSVFAQPRAQTWRVNIEAPWARAQRAIASDRAPMPPSTYAHAPASPSTLPITWCINTYLQRTSHQPFLYQIYICVPPPTLRILV